MDTQGSPLFLGTGSTGMLLITNKPIADQAASRSHNGLDRTSEYLSPSFQHTPAMDLSYLDQPISQNRSIGGHGDSGISNGASLSQSSRYRSCSSLDKSCGMEHLETAIDRLRTPAHRIETAIDRLRTPAHLMDVSQNRSSVSSPRSHVMSRPSIMQDMCSPGSTHSMSHLINSSQGSPSRSSLLRSGCGLHEVGTTHGREYGDLHRALEESEQRRQLLVDRLRDAQDTIKMQAHRLSEIEDSAKDTDSSLEDLRFREKELQKKLTILDREKGSYHEKHMNSLKSQEQLQHRMELISTELSSLRATTELAHSDQKKKEINIQKLTAKVNDLEEENNKHIKVKDDLLKELSSLRQSLELSRSHTDYLESHDSECKADIIRLREDTQSLMQDKRSLSQKVATLDSKNYSLAEENKALAHNVQNLNDEKLQTTKQLTTVQDTLADVTTTLAATAADKERFFQHKLELSSQIDMIKYEKDNWNKLRSSLEDQINELNTEMTQLRHNAEKTGDDKRKQEEELTSTKQVSEMLSMELSKTKSQLNHALDQNQTLEQNKNLAFKQHGLYDQEIRSMDTQLKQHKQALASMKDEHQKDKTSWEQQNIRLKDELREINTQRNQVELKCHEIEAKLHQAEQNLKEHSDEQQREIDNWTSQCEKLTAANSRNDMEIDALNKRIMEMEDQNRYLKVNHNMYQTQYDELLVAREETKRLREENRRLLQERAENQQVIQLLEMQKNILAKTSEGSMSKIHDAQQLQYTVEQLIVEKQQLQEQLEVVENKQRMADKEASLHGPPGGHDESHDQACVTREQLTDLETQNQQMRSLNNRITEQLTRVEQENVVLQSKYRDCVSKTEYKSIERERDQLENTVTQLEQQQQKQQQQEQLASKTKGTKSSESDTWMVHKEKEELTNQISVLTGQITALEDNKRTASEENDQQQKQMDALHEKFFNVCQENKSQVLVLQKQINKQKADLEEAKQINTNQNNLVHMLKEELDDEKTKKPSKLTQSLDDVGEDLTVVRTELQQLGEVIQGKDMEIEQLERQLRVVRERLAEKEKQIEMLTTGTGSGKEEDEQEGNRTHTNSMKGIQRQLEERLEELEEEKEELTDKSVKLCRERDLAVRDAVDLRDAFEDMKKICDKDHISQLEKFRKSIASKDRQIESLEEQLRRNTRVDLKKLKRGASMLDLLKTENRTLKSQVSMSRSSGPPPLVPSTPPVHSSAGQRLRGHLHGGITSPSQLLLSHHHGDENNEEDATVAMEERSSTGTSWEDSSEDDPSPTATRFVDEILSQLQIAECSQSKINPLNKDRLAKFEGNGSEEKHPKQFEPPRRRKSWTNENGCKNGQDEADGRRSSDAGRLRNLSPWNSTGEIKKSTGSTLTAATRLKSKSCSDVAQKTKLKSILKSYSKYDLSETRARSPTSARSITISISPNSINHTDIDISLKPGNVGTEEVSCTAESTAAHVTLSPNKYEGLQPSVQHKPIMGPTTISGQNKTQPRPTTSRGLPTVTSKIDGSACARTPIIGGRAPHPPSVGHVPDSHQVDGSVLTSSGRTGKCSVAQSAAVSDNKKSFPWRSNKK